MPASLSLRLARGMRCPTVLSGMRDALAYGAGGQGVRPCVRPVRDAFERQMREGGFDGVRDEVLGGGEVADEVYERGGEPARVVADHTGQLGVRGMGHGSRVIPRAGGSPPPGSPATTWPAAAPRPGRSRRSR